MNLAPMLTSLKALEDQVSEAAAAEKASNRMRVYMWRPPSKPELPAIWNWIDDGSYEIVDTARADDLLVVRATIAVRFNAAAIDEELARLVVLADHFRTVVDPALNNRVVLPVPEADWGSDHPYWDPDRPELPPPPTAKSAKRVVTRTSIDWFDEVPVQCIDMLIRVQLPHMIA